MHARRAVLSVGLALTLCALASNVAKASAVTAEYDVRYGFLTILSLRATSEIAAERYRGSAEMATVGVVAALFPWRSSAVTEGKRDEGGLHPVRHWSTGQYRNRPRTVAIAYASDGDVSTEISPRAEDDDRDAVPFALQQSAVDPLTAILDVVDRGCRGDLPVFDGRRRYDIKVSDLGEGDVPSSRGLIYRGRARHCQGDIKPLAGFWRSEPQHERPTRIDCWIASPQPDLPPIPVYLEVASSRGKFTIQLTSVNQ